MALKEVVKVPDLSVVAGHAEAFGVIDPRTIKKVREHIGEPAAEVFRKVFLRDRDVYGRLASAKDKFPANVKTVARFFEEKKAEISQQTGSEILPGIDIVNMIGLDVRTLWGFSVAGDKMIALLLGGNNLNLAEEYNKALVNCLLGKQNPSKTARQSGFFGFLQGMFDGGPQPIDVVQGIIGESGLSADSNGLLKAIMAATAVSSYGVIMGRKAIADSEKHLRAAISKELDKGNSAVKKIGPGLSKVEKELAAVSAQRSVVQAELSGLLGTSGKADAKIIASDKLTSYSKQVLAYEAQFCALNERMDTALLSVLGADARVDTAAAMLNSMRQNVGELAEGVVFRHFVLERLIADTIACLAYTSREQNRIEQARIMYEYREKIQRIPNQIREEIQASYKNTGNESSKLLPESKISSPSVSLPEPIISQPTN